MKIQDVDKNFALGQVFSEKGIKYYSIPHPDFSLKGVYYNEEERRFMRFPKDVAKNFNERIADVLCYHTAGGRIRFSTSSKKFVLKVTYDFLWATGHFALTGTSGFVLLENNKSGYKHVKSFIPPVDAAKGYTLSCDLKGGKMRDYTLFMPLYNSIDSLTIGLSSRAKVNKGTPYKDVKPILYYGSSITQGGCASRPDNCYQNFIFKKNNVDYVNYGFSGNAKAEDEMAEFLSNVDCSLFVYDYDHNAPSLEHLQNTHFRLFEKFRKTHKDVPVIMISKPNYNKNPKEDKLRKQVIYNSYLKAKESGDKNVYFIDGISFYGGNIDFTVDGNHPTDLGFYFMAKKIYKVMSNIDEKFR